MGSCFSKKVIFYSPIYISPSLDIIESIGDKIQRSEELIWENINCTIKDFI